MIKKILWFIFGNNDEPQAPDWYRPEWPRWRRQLYWLLFRNPLHNFTFYVIGIADRRFSRLGDFPNDVFSPAGGWNICMIYYPSWQGYWLRLPFASYQGKHLKAYIGWRERGNFGFKFTGWGRAIVGAFRRK